MSINKAAITGNLTRDPEEKRTQGGMYVLEFGVAVNERRKNGEEWEDYANFLDCTMYGTRAEKIAPYLSKGTHVAIEAHIRQERWEKDGQKRSKVKLIVDDIDFSGNRRGEEQQPQEPQQPQQPSLYDEDMPF